MEQSKGDPDVGELSNGIVACVAHIAALNDKFRIATADSTPGRDFAETIWRKINGDGVLTLVDDYAFEDDAKCIPDVTKARQVLGAKCPNSLDEVPSSVTQVVADGRH